MPYLLSADETASPSENNDDIETDINATMRTTGRTTLTHSPKGAAMSAKKGLFASPNTKYKRPKNLSQSDASTDASSATKSTDPGEENPFSGVAPPKAPRGRARKDSRSSSPRRRSTSSGASSRGRSTSTNRSTADLHINDVDNGLPLSAEKASSQKRPLSKERKSPAKSRKKEIASPASKAKGNFDPEPLKKKVKLSPKAPKRDPIFKGILNSIKVEPKEDENSKNASAKLSYDRIAQSIENVINMSDKEFLLHFTKHAKDILGKTLKKPKKYFSLAKKATSQKKTRKVSVKKEKSDAASKVYKKKVVPGPPKKRGRPKGSKNKKKPEDGKAKKIEKRPYKKKVKEPKTKKSQGQLQEAKTVKGKSSCTDPIIITNPPKIAADSDSTNKAKDSGKKDHETHPAFILPKKKASKASKVLSTKLPKPKLPLPPPKGKAKTPVKKPKHLSCLPMKKRIRKKEEEERAASAKYISKSAKVKWKLEDSDEEKETKFKKESEDESKKPPKVSDKSPKRKVLSFPFRNIPKKEILSESANSSEEDNDCDTSRKPLKKVIKAKWKREQKKQKNDNKKAMGKKIQQSSILPKKRKVTFCHERRSSPKSYEEMQSDASESDVETSYKRYKLNERRKYTKKKETFQKEASPPRRQMRMASLNAMAMMHCMNEDAKVPLPSLPPATSKDNSMALVLRESTIARAHSDDSDSESDCDTHASSGHSSKRKEEEEKNKPKKDDKQKRKRRRGELDVQMDMRDMVVTKRMASLNASAIMAASYSMESRSRKAPPASTSESEVTNVDIKRKISYKSTKDQSTKTRSVITVQETTKKVKKAQGSRETEVEEHIIVKKRVKRQSGLEAVDTERDDDNATDNSETDQEMLPKSPESGMIVESTITYVTTHTHTVPKTVSVSGVSKYSISSTNGKSTTVVQQVQRKSTTANPPTASATLEASPHPISYNGQPSPASISQNSAPHNYSPLGALSVMQPVMQPVMHPHPPPSHPLPYHPPHHQLPHALPGPPYPHLGPPPMQAPMGHHQFHPLPHPSPPYPLTPHSPPYPPPPRSASSAGSSPVCSSSPSTTPRPLSSPQSIPSPHPSLASSGYGTSPNGGTPKGNNNSTGYGQQPRSTSASGKPPSSSQPSGLHSPSSDERAHSQESPATGSAERHHSAFTAPTPSAHTPTSVSSHGYQPVSGPMPIAGTNSSPTYKPQLSPGVGQSPYSSPSRLTSPPPPQSKPPPPQPPPSFQHGPDHYPALPHPPPQSFQGYPYPAPPYEKYYSRGPPYHLYQPGYPGGQYPNQSSPDYSYPPPHPPGPGGHSGPGTVHYSQESYTSRTLCVPAPPHPPSYGPPQMSPTHSQPPLALPPPPTSGGSPHHPSLSNANYPYPDYGPVLMYPSTGPPPPPPQSGMCCPTNPKNVHPGPLTGAGKGSERDSGPHLGSAGTNLPGNYQCYNIGCSPQSMNPPYPPQHHHGPAAHSWTDRKPPCEKGTLKPPYSCPSKAAPPSNNHPAHARSFNEKANGVERLQKDSVAKTSIEMSQEQSHSEISEKETSSTPTPQSENGRNVSDGDGQRVLPSIEKESKANNVQTSLSSNLSSSKTLSPNSSEPKNLSRNLPKTDSSSTSEAKPNISNISEDKEASVGSSTLPPVPSKIEDIAASSDSKRSPGSKNDLSATSTSSSSLFLSEGQVLPASSACVSPVAVPQFQTIPVNNRTLQTTTWVVQSSASPIVSTHSEFNSDASRSTAAHLSSTTTTTSISLSNAPVSTNSVMSSSSPLVATAEVLQKQPEPENSSDTLIKELSLISRNSLSSKEKSKIESKIETLFQKAGSRDIAAASPMQRHLLCFGPPPFKNSKVLPKVKALNEKPNASIDEKARKSVDPASELNDTKNGLETPPESTEPQKTEICDTKNELEISKPVLPPRKRGRPPKSKGLQGGHKIVVPKGLKGAGRRKRKNAESPIASDDMKDQDHDEQEELSGAVANGDQSNLNDDAQNCNSAMEEINDSSLNGQEHRGEKNQDHSEGGVTNFHRGRSRESDDVRDVSLESKELQFFRGSNDEVSGGALTRTQKTTGNPPVMSVPVSIPMIGLRKDVKPSDELKTLKIKTEFIDKIKSEKLSPEQNVTVNLLTDIEKLKLLNGDSELSFRDLLSLPSDKLDCPGDIDSAFLEKLFGNQNTDLKLALEKKAAQYLSEKWDNDKLEESPSILSKGFIDPPKRSSKSPQNTRIMKASKGEKKKKFSSGKARRTASLLAFLKERNNESDASSVDMDIHPPLISEEMKKGKKKDELKKHKPSPFPTYSLPSPRRRRSSGSLKGKTLKKPKYVHGWSWEGESHEGKIWLRNDEPITARKCYSSMKHKEGDSIKVRDCVLLRSGPRKTDLPFVAKVAALWEDPETSDMMMSILWYYRPEHTDSGRRDEDLTDEIFASKHRDHLSVACIEDRCYVLTFNEYCRYRRLLRLFQEGLLPSSSPVPDNEDDYGRKERQPAACVVPELLFFCRKVYDYRQKRILKNPPC